MQRLAVVGPLLQQLWDQHRRGLSQALLQEQNILPQGS